MLVLINQSQQRPLTLWITCIELHAEQGKLPRDIPSSFAVYIQYTD